MAPRSTEGGPVSSQAPNLVTAMARLAASAAITALVPPSALTGRVSQKRLAPAEPGSAENRSGGGVAAEADGEVDGGEHAGLLQGGVADHVVAGVVPDGADPD